jgi:hypothetical protein
VQAGEGQLHLGLDAHRLHDGQVRRCRDQELQQRRLPDSGFAPNHQRSALASADGGKQLVQQSALVRSAEEAHGALDPANRLFTERNRRESTAQAWQD